jgi:hypothetical protein
MPNPATPASAPALPDEFTIRRLAAELHMDPRTLRKGLEGRPVRGLRLQESIDRARASLANPKAA